MDIKGRSRVFYHPLKGWDKAWRIWKTIFHRGSFARSIVFAKNVPFRRWRNTSIVCFLITPRIRRKRRRQAFVFRARLRRIFTLFRISPRPRTFEYKLLSGQYAAHQVHGVACNYSRDCYSTVFPTDRENGREPLFQALIAQLSSK